MTNRWGETCFCLRAGDNISDTDPLIVDNLATDKETGNNKIWGNASIATLSSELRCVGTSPYRCDKRKLRSCYWKSSFMPRLTNGYRPISFKYSISNQRTFA